MILLYILGALFVLLFIYILFLGICAFLVSPHKEYTSDSPFYRFLLDSGTAVFLRCSRVKIHVTGTEKLPTDKKLLFVGNHRSNFDPIVTWWAFQKWKIAYISKPGNFKIPFFGKIIRKCCFMPIDRSNPRKAIVTVNKAAKLLASQEVSVGIYPEGTRSRSGELLPFHNGVFKIAQKADADMAVLTVRGTENIRKNYPLRRTHVYIDVLTLIPADTVQATKTDVLGQHIRNLMEEQLQKR